MAIYHLTAKIIKRSAGRSAVAAAAYRAGAQYKDKRTGLTHNYARRKDVVHCELLTPDVVPLFAADRETLWNTVELGEKRKDAQVAREIELALPRELSRSQQITLTRSFAKESFVKRGMIADVAIHDKEEGNPHAHIMLTMRELSADGFGEKARQWNDKKLLQEWRASWEKEANQALELVGSKARIDHRTLEAQGINRAPQQHVGMAASALAFKNKPSERTERFKQIEQDNIVQLEDIRALKLEHAKLQQEIEALEKDLPQIITPRRSRGGAAPQIEQGLIMGQEEKDQADRLREIATGKNIEEQRAERSSILDKWQNVAEKERILKARKRRAKAREKDRDNDQER